MNQVSTLAVIIHLFAAMVLSPARAQEVPAKLPDQIAQNAARSGD